MKKKQWIGLVMAGIIFIVTGAAGVVVSKSVKDSVKNWQSSLVFGRLRSNTNEQSVKDIDDDYVEVINVEGTIQAYPTTSALGEYSGYNHQFVMSCVETAMNDSLNKGLILKINSPGGAVYEADELYLKLQDYKKKTGRPIWVYMENQACSGGYYIAMAGDKIYANRNTWTGSIGVIISSYNMKEFYDKLGIKEVNITSGKNKAIGSGGEEMTKEQREILQSLVDNAFDQFVSIVAEGRDMKAKEVKRLADGRIYDAGQAKRLKLIDEIGRYEEFEKAFKSEIGYSDIYMYEPVEQYDPVSGLLSRIKELKPKSEAEILMDEFEKNGGLMYYAKP